MNRTIEDLAVQVEDLYFEYEVGAPILDGFDLRVPRGAICGMLGRNGCGKSTLLQCLIGMLEPENGTCRVLGLDALEETLKVRHRVGYVPQMPQFEPKRTGEEQLDFIRPLYGGRWNQQLENDLLDDFGLTLELHRPVGNLSNGQQRQLSLVVALAFEPDLLILDEPTAGLDAVVRRRFTERVVEYMAEPGRTVLLASHLISDVERLVDHVVVFGRHRPMVAVPLEDLKASLACLEARFGGRPPLLDPSPDLLMQRRHGDTLKLAAWTRELSTAELKRRLEGMGSISVEEVDPSLESVFVHLVEGVSDDH